MGLGIVEETAGATRPRGARSLAVAVYVTKKLPLDQLDPDDVVPPVLEIVSGRPDAQAAGGARDKLPTARSTRTPRTAAQRVGSAGR